MQSRISRSKNKKTNCRPLPQRKCTPSQQHGIYTIELQSPSTFHGKYLLQTDDVDIEFLKVFTEYVKNIQHQNSQKANSIFTNEVFRIVYSFLSILEKPKSHGNSLVQTSKHATVKHEITIFSDY